MLQMIPTVVGVVLLTFVLFNIVPNDLAAIALGKNVTLRQLDEFDAKPASSEGFPPYVSS